MAQTKKALDDKVDGDKADQGFIVSALFQSFSPLRSAAAERAFMLSLSLAMAGSGA